MNNCPNRILIENLNYGDVADDLTFVSKYDTYGIAFPCDKDEGVDNELGSGSTLRLYRNKRFVVDFETSNTPIARERLLLFSEDYPAAKVTHYFANSSFDCGGFSVYQNGLCLESQETVFRRDENGDSPLEAKIRENLPSSGGYSTCIDECFEHLRYDLIVVGKG